MTENFQNYRYSPRQAPISANVVSCPGNYIADDAHMHHLNELIIISKPGKIHLFTNGSRISLPSPALILHRAGSYHYLRTEGMENEGYSCFCIYFSDQHVKQIPEALLHSAVLLNEDCLAMELTEDDCASLSPYTALLDTVSGAPEKNLFLLLIILNEMHCLLKKRRVHRISTSNSYIFNVVQYLLDHSSEALTTVQIAAKFHVSVSKINNDFHKITGQTLNRFCANVRLNRAAELLLSHPDMPISEVAYSCGYSSESYFIQTFQKEKGMTPRAFRRQYEEQGKE